MGLIGVSPPAIMLPRDLRGTRRVAWNGAEAPAGKRGPGKIAAPLARKPEPAELITACAENCLRSADELAATRMAERFAPHVPPQRAAPARAPQFVAQAPPVATLPALGAATRKLALLILAAALLPNLTVAALWLGLIAPPWSKPAPESASEALPGAELAIPLPVLSVPAALEAESGHEIGFPIALDGTDGVPPDSAILVKGLPRGARLSNGVSQSDAAWRLTPGEIGDLSLAVPSGASGDSMLIIQLVASGGRVVADASTLLRVAPAPPPDSAIETVTEEPAVEQQLAALAVAAEETAALPEALPVDADAPPLPDRRPEPPASDSRSADWVSPSAYVNLRQAPAATASVVGVVAKGVKLRVLERKRGWVQVADPASSKAGWIYSGYLTALR
jgi:hypothetical protein